jgi:hypothetical protein
MIRGKIHAAAHLARRLEQGHEVALVEAQPRLAARYPLPEQHRRFIHWATSPNWLEQEVFRLGVDVSRAQLCHAPSGVCPTCFPRAT